MYDIIIRNGTLIDGTRADRKKADVALEGDRIAAIGDLSTAEAAHTIDAIDKILTPGFVDVHNHSDGWLLKTPNFVPKTIQGFTTEVIMADGISYAPVDPSTRAHWIYYMRALNGLQMSDYRGWESLADYMNLLDGRTARTAPPAPRGSPAPAMRDAFFARALASLSAPSARDDCPSRRPCARL